MLALDVSSSVDVAEDRLQREGLVAALRSPDVQAAFLANEAPVALQVFEWSGRAHQVDLIEWQMIRSRADIDAAANRIAQTERSASGQQTAMGYALGYAAQKLETGPSCLFQTIDMAGDGANNAGPGPAAIYATFPFDGIIVNGLVVRGEQTGVTSYFENTVKRGPGAFVETANGFADFEAAMRRKLVRELTAQIIGRADHDNGDLG